MRIQFSAGCGLRDNTWEKFGDVFAEYMAVELDSHDVGMLKAVLEIYTYEAIAKQPVL